ncbi:hypothetical protein PBAHNIPP_00281 [Klebsiella phage KP01]
MTNAELVKEIKHIAGVTGGWDDNYDFEYPPNAPDDDAEEIFVLVEDVDWTQEHKYQDRTQIWYYPARGVHFMVSESRSGSYHTDWYYSPPEVDIVTRHEKVVTRTEVEWRIEHDSVNDSEPTPCKVAKV